MPDKIKVELLPHSTSWEQAAKDESLRILQALVGVIVEVHHIGSTAIPGIHATRQLLDDLAKSANIDPKRVFATGMSNGGIMSYLLASELSDRIAAIAPARYCLPRPSSISCWPWLRSTEWRSKCRGIEDCNDELTNDHLPDQ